MNDKLDDTELRKLVLDVLGGIAPEADFTAINPEVNLRDQLDFDSVDFLNFMLALHERLGVDIPELDYPQLTSINSAVRYLAGRTG